MTADKEAVQAELSQTVTKLSTELEDNKRELEEAKQVQLLKQQVNTQGVLEKNRNEQFSLSVQLNLLHAKLISYMRRIGYIDVVICSPWVPPEWSVTQTYQR